MHYPSDTATHSIDTQFFYGPSLLISPVTEPDSTSVTFYLPDDIFYDLFNLTAIRGSGESITYDNVMFDAIPVHIRGGSIIPARVNSAMTTTELREQDFELLIALDEDGRAEGSLYLDDGENLEQEGVSEIEFTFDGGVISMGGTFGFPTSVRIVSVTVLGGVEEGALKYGVDVGLDGPWRLYLSGERGTVL